MKKLLWLLLPCVIALLGVSFLSPRQAALAAVSVQESGNVRLPSDPTELPPEEFWTPDKVAAAEQNSPPGFEQVSTGAELGPVIGLLADGPAMVAKGNGIGSPSGAAEFKAIAFPGPWTLPYPPPFTLGYLQISGLSNSAPYSTYGKLYYMQHGSAFVCSGNSVSSGPDGNYSLILTAAHCLHDGSGSDTGLSTNIAFVPGKLGAYEPFGQFTASAIWVPTSWYSGGNPREDFGFIVANPGGCGNLGSCAGTQGLAWNQSPYGEFFTIGYPSVTPFPGDRQVLCTGPTFTLDSSATGTGAPPLGMGCSMTAGSSGAGWALDFKTANLAYINSVIAYKYVQPSQPSAVYGPYFGSSFQSLWNSARLDVP